MPTTLRSGLHYCQFDSGFVLFDLPADRYFLLTDRSAERFARVLQGTATSADAEPLSAMGLLASDEPESHRHETLRATATRSLIDEPCDKASMAATISCIWEQHRVRRDLQRNSLGDIVTRLGRGRERLSPAGGNAYREIAAAFVRARRYMSADDQCLVRGIAMVQILARRGLAASLVFGVTMPFAAHIRASSSRRSARRAISPR